MRCVSLVSPLRPTLVSITQSRGWQHSGTHWFWCGSLSHTESLGAGEVCATLTWWSHTCPGRLQWHPPGQRACHCWASWHWGRCSPKANMQNSNVTACLKTLPGFKTSWHQTTPKILLKASPGHPPDYWAIMNPHTRSRRDRRWKKDAVIRDGKRMQWTWEEPKWGAWLGLK